MQRRTFVSAVGVTLASLKPSALALADTLAAYQPARAAADLADDEDFWFQVQQAFTVDRNNINLNNGSVAPSPRSVQRAQLDYLTLTNMSPSHYVDEMLYPEFEVVRRRLAARFGCDPEELAITRNTTEALEAVQLGMPLARGDEVITTTQDYPSMHTAWRQRERRDGIVLKVFSFPVPSTDPDDLVRRFEGAITPRTKVLHVSHVYFTTGQIAPIQRLCRMARARGIEVVVDGGHAFAQFPFTRDDLDCDYFGTSLHKWLSAPVGTGFLYVRRSKIKSVWPLFAAPAEMEDNIRKFEAIGTFPVHIRNPITEALDFHEAIGPERKAARLRFLRRRWTRHVAQFPRVRLLTPDDDAQSCALGAMSIDGLPGPQLVDHLMTKHRIHVRARIVPNEFSCIRVTPNVYTTVAEIDAFAKAIELVATKGL
ncbi:MAG TPA: aminotransferase class V-fold PLP-dependent enzyme [Gemmatimonadaceae bacterium]|nr:aminotransferase class V-fold PLP-dependent enzyme [Gemmatimonadaceae bacterium]